MPAVHAAIVNYNSYDDTVRCTLSLLESGIDSLVIVDNASPQEEGRRLRNTLSSEKVRVVASTSNLGFAGGVRSALSAMNGRIKDSDYLWVVNPDMVVNRDALDKLRAAVESGSVDLISPTVYWGTGSDRRVWFEGGTLDLERGESRHGPSEDRLPTGDLHRCTFLSGAAIFARYEVWVRLGGFDPKFFLYWEDADFCRRAVSLGLKLGVATNASVWHRVGGSSGGQRSPGYYYYMTRNRVLMCSTSWSRFGPGWRERLLTSLRWVYWAARDSDKPISKVIAVIRGTLDGYRGISGRSFSFTPPSKTETAADQPTLSGSASTTCSNSSDTSDSTV